MIARCRLKDNQIICTTLGTGVLVAPNRMVTASHVINDPDASKTLMQHLDGDIYYLIRHDDEGNWHYRYYKPTLNKGIFLYPEVDLAIFYLEDAFYADEKNTYLLKSDFIPVDIDFKTIGTEIGVLGYPMCSLDFKTDINSPKFGDVLLRADSGIINCRYKTSESVSQYEFTVAFNPGNSGGPIFDMKTGKLISLVHGYRAIPIKMKILELTKEEKIKFGVDLYEKDSYLDVVHASYSKGFATPSFVTIFRQHKL